MQYQVFRSILEQRQMLKNLSVALRIESEAEKEIFRKKFSTFESREFFRFLICGAISIWDKKHGESVHW